MKQLYCKKVTIKYSDNPRFEILKKITKSNFAIHSCKETFVIYVPRGTIKQNPKCPIKKNKSSPVFVYAKKENCH